VIFLVISATLDGLGRLISQRPPGSARAVQACAEALPVADDAADAVMALLTVHHWDGLEAGAASWS
jgi:hypothetical protein